ncbi:MAG TPA: RNA polymerase sigma-70 factor [Sphingobacterium sp.]|nr:RNA polymerase sigma-70 factor [Sphingobacterium sp.]
MALDFTHNEKEILKNVSRGDQRSFTMLFDIYYQNLGAYVYKITESREVTEEIVQDVFVKIWENREVLGNIECFKAYLFILSKNKTLDYLRLAAKARTRQLSILRNVQEDSYVIDDLSPIEELRLIVEETVSQLPPQQQRVYRLSRQEKLKYEEIAVQMGISKETVKKHMKLALAFLKERVKAQIQNVAVGLLLIALFYS